MKTNGLLMILSGPAGSGKGTIVSHLLEKHPEEYALSVSATTRSPRPMEKEGQHYFFISKEEFEHRIETGRMLEYASYCGNYYGTPREYVEEMVQTGKTVILEIEVQGALQVKKLMPDALLLMVTPPDFETLEKRLRGRHTNTEEDIQNRLRRSREELSLLYNYDYAVISENNKSLEAAEKVHGIIMAEKQSVKRNPDFMKKFFNE